MNLSTNLPSCSKADHRKDMPSDSNVQRGSVSAELVAGPTSQGADLRRCSKDHVSTLANHALILNANIG